ncbi:hypothetical protein Tco_0760407 [Tanacetum coccineum]
MKKIILRRADLKEYVIAERDFKYMYPSDFEDLYLLNLQGHLNHLSPDDKKVLTTAVNLWTRNLVIRQRVEDFQLGIKSYQTQLNLTKPRWDATGFEFKHDYTVIDSPKGNYIQRQIRGADDYESQKDKSRDEYKILDEERRCQKQGVHVRYPEMAKDTTYLPKSGELYYVIGINKDDIDEEDDESSTMEPPSRNEAIKAAITLNNFLLSYEKTTPECCLPMLRKLRDEIQGEIDFNKTKDSIESFFIKKPS